MWADSVRDVGDAQALPDSIGPRWRWRTRAQLAASDQRAEQPDTTTTPLFTTTNYRARSHTHRSAPSHTSVQPFHNKSTAVRFYFQHVKPTSQPELFHLNHHPALFLILTEKSWNVQLKVFSVLVMDWGINYTLQILLNPLTTQLHPSCASVVRTEQYFLCTECLLP